MPQYVRRQHYRLGQALFQRDDLSVEGVDLFVQPGRFGAEPRPFQVRHCLLRLPINRLPADPAFLGLPRYIAVAAAHHHVGAGNPLRKGYHAHG
jgi:hypothetical protein